MHFLLRFLPDLQQIRAFFGNVHKAWWEILHGYMVNLFLFPEVKEIWKLVEFYWMYYRQLGGTFFETQCSCNHRSRQSFRDCFPPVDVSELWLSDKRDDIQNCPVQYSLLQLCTVMSTYTCEFLTSEPIPNGLGFFSASFAGFSLLGFICHRFRSDLGFCAFSLGHCLFGC